jgi:hypothetical protein
MLPTSSESQVFFCLSKNVDIKVHKTIHVRVDLCGCQIWSVSVWYGHILRIFENRVLRRLFVPEIDEMTDCWGKLHNEELYNLYCLV